MMTDANDATSNSGEPHGDEPTKTLSAAAKRALAEAEARRIANLKLNDGAPTEYGGRGGLEPGRYGDWEVKGLTSDF